MSNLPAIGHGLFAGYVGDNLAIDCYWPDESNPPPRGCRVVVQRADVPDLLKAILVADEYARTVAPRLLASTPRLPVGIDPPATASEADALHAAWGGPTPPARPAIDDTEHDERALWRALAVASARGGNSPFAAAKEATMALAEYRKLFGPKEAA